MDRLEAMAVLMAAVDGGSLSAAGRSLGMPLPTVSRKVSELEAHLGTRLLHRTTRQLVLTDAGRDYVAACRRILDEVGDAERAAAGEFSRPSGELVITAPLVFGRLHVVPVVSDFLREFPDVDVRLVLGDRIVNLLDDHVDLAVRIGALPDSRLHAVRVGTIGRVACASPGYLAEFGEPTLPRDLQNHRCIAFEAMLSPTAWRFVVDGRDTPVPVRPRLVVNAAEAAIDAAISGLGVTRVLSYQIAQAQRDGTLVRVLAAFEPAPMPVSLVYPDQGRLPLKLRAFLDFAAPRLRGRMQAA